MRLGLYSSTHGLLIHRGADYILQPTPGREMRPAQIAQQAEQLGYHSLWFGDHVAVPAATATRRPDYPGNPDTGESPYPPGANLLDAAVTMGACAAVTSRIKLASGVLIGPFRHPLSDARQYATVDVLSNGRLILGTAAGWLRHEFATLGVPYEERGPISEECIQIYKKAWTDTVVSFHGRYYDFTDVSMEPKPVQRPHPPIILASVSRAGARRAARLCDGFFPEMVDAHPDPFRFAGLQDEIRQEAARIGRDLGTFSMWTCAAARVADPTEPLVDAKMRPALQGTPDQILADLGQFAAAGYSLVVCYFAVPSGALDELQEQIERFGTEVLPHAASIQAAGEWRQPD